MSTLEKQAWETFTDCANFESRCDKPCMCSANAERAITFARKYAAEMVRKASCKIYQIGTNVSEEERSLGLAKAINLTVDDCFVFADRIEKGEET